MTHHDLEDIITDLIINSGLAKSGTGTDDKLESKLPFCVVRDLGGTILG